MSVELGEPPQDACVQEQLSWRLNGAGVAPLASPRPRSPGYPRAGSRPHTRWRAGRDPAATTIATTTPERFPTMIAVGPRRRVRRRPRRSTRVARYRRLRRPADSARRAVDTSGVRSNVRLGTAQPGRRCRRLAQWTAARVAAARVGRDVQSPRHPDTPARRLAECAGWRHTAQPCSSSQCSPGSYRPSVDDL